LKKIEKIMPRFAANISDPFLFNEIAFLERFAAAAEAGFTAVEFHSPYGYDKPEIADRLDKNDLALALFNLPPGDWDRGERGIACLPGRVAEFQDGVGHALDYAIALGCCRINCLAGLAPENIPAKTLHETFVSNLQYAAAQTAKAGITLLIEPINNRDMPGFYLNTSKQALSIIDDVGAPNLMLQYDIYHARIMEGGMAATIEANARRIGHFQIADVPGRHEPGTGDIDYPNLFALIDRIGYDGWVGCEYKPAAATVAGLAWAEPYLARG